MIDVMKTLNAIVEVADDLLVKHTRKSGKKEHTAGDFGGQVRLLGTVLISRNDVKDFLLDLHVQIQENAKLIMLVSTELVSQLD